MTGFRYAAALGVGRFYWLRRKRRYGLLHNGAPSRVAS